VAKTREPESKAMQEARAELQAVVWDLMRTKNRLLRLALRLKRAAKTAETVAIGYKDEVYTAEGWMAGEVHESARSDLGDAIEFLRNVARSDRRDTIREDVGRDDERDARENAAAAAAGVSHAARP